MFVFSSTCAYFGSSIGRASCTSTDRGGRKCKTENKKQSNMLSPHHYLRSYSFARSPSWQMRTSSRVYLRLKSSLSDRDENAQSCLRVWPSLTLMYALVFYHSSYLVVEVALWCRQRAGTVLRRSWVFQTYEVMSSVQRMGLAMPCAKMQSTYKRQRSVRRRPNKSSSMCLCGR